MAPTIRMHADYPHPPERVWTALTDARALTEWLMPTTDFQPVLGHRFQFKVENARGWRTVVDCEIVAIAPPNMLAYTWVCEMPGGRRLNTRVTWTLQPRGAGTRLVLEQTGFRGGVASLLLRTFALGPGWRRMMKRLLPRVLARVGDAGAFVPDPAMAADNCH